MSQNFEDTEILPWEDFAEEYSEVAGIQGRLCYCLMSIHAVNPYILHRFLWFDPSPYLLFNILYGFGFMIASNMGLQSIHPCTRTTMGFLGSMSFTYASMQYFSWLNSSLPNSLYLRTFLGYFSGRIFLMHLLAFLYHLDTRTSGLSATNIEYDPAFESMYIS